jgi:gliding motility-associated-like protein
VRKVNKYIAPVFLVFCLLLVSFPGHATHNRAGEITYRLISGLTYEVTITTYTYTLSKADRTQLDIQWGDNTSSIAPRIQQIVLPNYYFRNTYKAQHTFPGPGVYELVVQDPNRNFGVKNIPNSVNVIFSIKSSLVISPLTGSNSTPELLNPPIDKAARGRIFIHNPSAYDKEGDSLSYELAVCTEENGTPITNFTFPKASDTLYVDAVTGDLVWNTPVDTGIYNVALRIKEYRKGYMIGSVTRDMQINVYESSNHPPVNPALPDYCVEAGDSVVFDFTVTDPEKDKIYIRGTGGPFQIEDPLHRAAIDSLGSGIGYTTARFSWVTSCKDVRERPYQITIKSSDQNPQLSLNDLDEFFIHVTGPAPEGLSAYSSVNSVRLSWDPYQCSQAIRFEIYRRINASDFVPDSCETGIPGDAGFVRVGSTSSGTVYNYLDDDNGNGLEQGYQYCYRIIAIFPDGSSSRSSEEICTSLVPGIPALLNCSVTKLDETDGEVFLSWLQPKNLDTIPANGPYKLIISRSHDLWGSGFAAIDSVFTVSLEDTTYTDTPLNTLDFPYSYKVELFNDSAGNWLPVGRPETASTFYPELTGSDNKVEIKFLRNVPWINTRYVIYRLNALTSNFDSIGYTDTELYADTGLANGIVQTYRARSIGHRKFETFTISTENYSHKASTTPVDTVPPCAPVLKGRSACDSLYNQLKWYFSDNLCSEDIVQFNIYYSPTYNGVPGKIQSLTDPADTMWRHYPAGGLAGCYQITAVDSFGNESPRSGIVCLDECTSFELPNVFTPNGDNINDIYTSINRNGAVKEVYMRIFNRWGTLVYETRDPDIRWNGKIMGTNKLVSSGVYYYTCDVFENRLTGLEVRNMVGFIHVFCETDSKNASDK